MESGRCLLPTSQRSRECQGPRPAHTTTAERSFPVVSRRHWERQASNWSAWARSASDAYWRFAPAFFDLVPPPKGRTLEVGCGEGRVTRDLIARGHHVVAVDITEALLRTAYESDDQGGYVRCDAAQLPFAPESFDLAVFYNSLMDIDEMPGSLDEAARVLRPGGHLCACVTHPIPDAGAFAVKNLRAHVEDRPLEAVITPEIYDQSS